MVIFHDSRRFEITATPDNDSWIAKFLAFVPGRLYPTIYLMREVSTREEALTALERAWHRLFPEEAPLQWHNPRPPSPARIPHRSRPPEGPRG